MKRLGATQRKLLVAVAICRRQRGTGPSWGALQRAAGIHSRAELHVRLTTLRDQGLLTWADEQPYSTDITRRGVAVALARDEARA